MSLRSISLGLSLLTLWLLVDAPSAEAQLFRRLENRIRSRVATPPNIQAPSTQPQRAPTQSSGSLQPRTVAPQPRSDSQGPTANYPRRPGGNGLGGSILAPTPAGPTVAAPARPTLGIDVYESPTGIRGLSVVGIRDDSRAAEAGLAVGDVIVAMDGKPTPTIASIGAQLKQWKVGQIVRATIARGNRTSDIQIPLMASPVALAKPPVQPRGREPVAQVTPPNSGDPKGTAPTLIPVPEPSADQTASKDLALGVEIRDARGVRGALVIAVKPDSSAAAAGLREGDRIVSVDGRFISGSDGLIKEVSSRPGDDSFTFQVVRGDELVESVVDLKESASKPKLATDPAAAGATPPSQEPSLLNGIGSALGGLLSGNEAKKTEADADLPKDEPADVAKNKPAKVAKDKTAEVVKDKPAKVAKDEPAEVVKDEPVEKNLADDSRPNPFIQPIPDDPLAFGDEEPVRQVGFESPESPKPSAPKPAKGKPRRGMQPNLTGKGAGENGKRETGLSLDPPSLETLELPEEEAAPIGKATDAEKSLAELIAQLRAEIRLLEGRLQELEKVQELEGED